MGFVEDLKNLLCQVDNQSEMERQTGIAQSSLSRTISALKEGRPGNPTLKNLAPIIDLYEFRLVDPKKHVIEPESAVRDRIANDVMKELLKAGHVEIAGLVFGIITQTPTPKSEGKNCEMRAAGNN